MKWIQTFSNTTSKNHTQVIKHPSGLHNKLLYLAKSTFKVLNKKNSNNVHKQHKNTQNLNVLHTSTCVGKYMLMINNNLFGIYFRSTESKRIWIQICSEDFCLILLILKDFLEDFTLCNVNVKVHIHTDTCVTHCDNARTTA